MRVPPSASPADAAWPRAVLAFCAALIGASGLLGWLLGVPALQSVLPGLSAMRANVALGLMAAGSGLLLIPERGGGGWRLRLALAAGALACLLGLLTLAEHVSRIPLGLDQRLAGDPNTTTPIDPSRMSPATAAALGCTGVAILLLAWVARGPHGAGSRRAAGIAHLLAAVPAGVSYLSLASHAYAVEGLDGFGPFATVALNTAVALGLLAAAVLRSLPELGWGRAFAGRPVARGVLARLVPLSLVLPFLAGALVIWGARARLYDPWFSPALLALASACAAMGLAWVAVAAVRQAEGRLRDTNARLGAAEARLRLFIDHAPAGIAMLDRELRYLAASRRYLASYGLSERDIIGRGHYEVFPDTPLRWRDIHARCLAGAVEAREADPFPRADGRTDWVRWELRPWHEEDGAIGGLVLFSEVITERVAAEAALERAAEEFRTLADGIPTLCWMAEPDGHIYWYNRRWYDYTGTTQEQMEGWGWQSVHDPEALPSVLGRWRASIETGTPFEMTFPLRGADGQFRPFLTRVAPVRGADGRIRRWLGVNTDVSEALARKAALRRSEAQFRATADALPGMLFVTKPSGENTYVNDGFCAYTGRAREALLGDRWVEVLHPDDAERGWAIWNEAVQTGSAYLAEYRFRRHDGAWRWHMVRALPSREADGSIHRWVGTCTDIHDRRALEEALRRLTQTLEARVQEEVAAREAAQVRAAHAERMQALGQLAGGIAHDLNNVLQAVQGGAMLIERRAGDPENTRCLAKMVLEAVARGASITRRLLSFARRGDLRTEPVDAGALFEGLRDILAHALGAGIALRVEVEPGLPRLLADKGQLETALVNLATNARDAMPEGGTLTFAADRATVGGGTPRPAGLAPGFYVRLRVSDTGAGMDPAMLARVMEPFFTTKPQGKGTGLGLPMAQGFAEQSGGALQVESAPEQGATVLIWLPQADAALPPAAPPSPPLAAAAPGAGAAGRLLLVDDEAMVRETLTLELEEASYAVLAAADAGAALAALEAGAAVDILVTDLTMPGGMDGLGLIREARARQPGLPAVLLTGYAGDGTGAALAVSGIVNGAFSLLRKPVSGTQLADRVAALLAARQGVG